MNVLETYPKTFDTQISWELYSGDCVIDVFRTKKEAIEVAISIGGGLDIEPVMIDMFDGTVITDKNLELYLLPQYR